MQFENKNLVDKSFEPAKVTLYYKSFFDKLDKKDEAIKGFLPKNIGQGREQEVIIDEQKGNLNITDFCLGENDGKKDDVIGETLTFILFLIKF